MSATRVPPAWPPPGVEIPAVVNIAGVDYRCISIVFHNRPKFAVDLWKSWIFEGSNPDYLRRVCDINFSLSAGALTGVLYADMTEMVLESPGGPQKIDYSDPMHPCGMTKTERVVIWRIQNEDE